MKKYFLKIVALLCGLILPQLFTGPVDDLAEGLSSIKVKKTPPPLPPRKKPDQRVREILKKIDEDFEPSEAFIKALLVPGPGANLLILLKRDDDQSKFIKSKLDEESLENLANDLTKNQGKETGKFVGDVKKTTEIEWGVFKKFYKDHFPFKEDDEDSEEEE